MSPESYLRMQAVEHDHWWFAGRRSIISRIISKISLPDAPVILEAGCGSGGNLGMLSRFGKAYAFEMNEAALEHARKNKHGIQVEYGQLPNTIPFKNLKFDLICMFDVLEHVEDDLSALQGLSVQLNPGGYFFLTVPALPVLWSDHDVRLHHHRRYMREQLAELVQRAGLELVWVSYFNFSLLPAAFMSRWYARLLGKQVAGEELPPSLINRVFKTILSAERHWLFPNKLPVGLSLAAIARKSL